MNYSNEKDWVTLNSKIRTGSEKAFREFYKLTFPLLRSLCHKMFLSKEDAEDVIQETYAQVWHQRKSIKPEENLIGLLKIIAKRTVYKKIEAQKKNLMAFASEQKIKNTLAENSEEHWEVRTNLLRKYLHQLSPKQREVAENYYLNGLTVKEIAHFSKTAERTVENNLYRSRENLKVLFKQHNIEFMSFLTIRNE